MEDKPHRFLLVGLLGFVHAQGFIYLAFLSLWAMYRFRNFHFVFSTCLFSVIWFPVLVYQSLDVSNGWWNPPLSSSGVLAYFLDTTIGRAIYPAAGLAVYSVVIILTCVALWRWATSRPQNQSVLWLYLGIPGITALISLLWGSNIYIARSLLPAACLVCILWAYTLSTLPPRHVLRGATALALGVAVIALTTRPTFEYGDYLDCGERPVFATSNHLAIMAAHFNKGSTIYVREQGNDYSQYLTHEARDAMGFVAVDEPPQGACVLYQLSPLVDMPQRQWVEQLLREHPPQEQHLYIERDIYELWVYDL